MMHATAADRLSSTTERLVELYAGVRRTTEALCTPLSAEDQVIQSMPDASPAKWHQGHTTWFFETFLLSPHCPGYQAPDPRYRFFFNSYYKGLGGHPVRAQRGLWSRPSLTEILAYRRHVDEHMARWLESGIAPELVSLVELGCNHEQQHQELILTDIKHGLWTNPLHPAYREETGYANTGPAGEGTGATAPLRWHKYEGRVPHPSPSGEGALENVSPLRWHNYEGGLQSAGHDGDGFCFDNESPRHQVYLRPFQLASRLVTVGEYLEFMRDGGYTRPDLWLSEGWDTVNTLGWRAPLYWETQESGEWTIYTLNGQRLLDLAEPVCHVSYFEADAYARWSGARLATEFEWEFAAAQVWEAIRREDPTQAKLGWGTQTVEICHSEPRRGEEPLLSQPNLLDSNRLHPAPASGDGKHPQQLFGDVWEWTASQYLAYPGFRPAPGLVGEYNGKFMCNQFVLRGGSCATPANHIRPTYRNFFPPAARWQFTGIRLAHD